MTNTLGIDFDADLAEMVADMPAAFTWSSASYACVVSVVSSGTIVDMGGYKVQVTAQVLVRASLFTTNPASGDPVTLKGQSLRIVRVDEGHDDAMLLLTIGEVTA